MPDGTRNSRIVAQYSDDHGYLRVSLWRDGKRARVCVHRLVLRAFAGAPPLGLESLHGKHGRHDNRWPENLSYGTASKNIGDDRRRDRTSNDGARHYKARLTWDQVAEIRRRLAAGETQASVATFYDALPTTIWKIAHGLSWRPDRA